jgi:hypothetical protein
LKTQAQDREYKQRQRQLAIQMLGGRCVRCGIAHPLCIDHVNNDGYIEKQDYGRRLRPNQIAAQVISGKNWGRYQLLCHNCNYLKTAEPETFQQPPTYGPK